MEPSKRLTLQEILDHEFMRVPVGLSMSLSCSTLAVPPSNQQFEIERLNLNDMNIQQSEEVSLNKDSMGMDDLDRILSRKNHKMTDCIIIR